MQADPGEFAGDEGIPVTKLVNGTAALLSLGLMIGIGTWGYKTVTRDVSDVPVIRAATGELRVKPETPGGKPAAHQGLAVNKVAANGVAAPVPDQVILAPRALDLTEDDLTTAELAERARSRADRAAAEAAAAVAGPEKAEEELTDESIRKLATDLASGAQKLEPIPASADGGELRPETAALVTETASRPRPEHGLALSLRPRIRPAALKAALPASASVSAGPIDAPAALEPALDVDPATVEPGTRLAQLGAYESEEVARADWDRLSGIFGDVMEGKQRVIQKASSGGRTFYRLRALGFDDLSDARRFCAAFVANKPRAECIPVVAK
ncbi:MAG: SPOR domain-containing protein [Pseudooceanicola sp.]